MPSALGDLDRGRAFYPQHGEELGDHFLNWLFADIDSLALYAGIHIQIWEFQRMLGGALHQRVRYPTEIVLDRLHGSGP